MGGKGWVAARLVEHKRAVLFVEHCKGFVPRLWFCQAVRSGLQVLAGC
jgi:hypothetical protein